MRSSSNFLTLQCFLVKVSYWSKFHVNIRLMVLELWQFSFIKHWLEIRKSEIVWVLPNIWRLGQFRNIKFGANVSNEMLLNAAKWYRFYHFWATNLICPVSILNPLTVKKYIYNFAHYSVFLAFNTHLVVFLGMDHIFQIMH